MKRLLIYAFFLLGIAVTLFSCDKENAQSDLFKLTKDASRRPGPVSDTSVIYLPPDTPVHTVRQLPPNIPHVSLPDSIIITVQKGKPNRKYKP